jgi:16S rRNA (cytosine1402-N4)-methyltransferase
MRSSLHVPVLLEETMDFLGVNRDGIYVDCTIGLGGHALELLKRNPNARLIGFDLDEQSLLQTKERLAPYKDRVELYHSDFRYLPELELDYAHVRGLLLDLGISSYHLDSPDRGFSYNKTGPLDMRMDLRNKQTAAKLVNKSSESRLAQLFYDFGELRQARRLAKEIVSRRKMKHIETTTDLLEIVEDVCHWRPQKGKTHPAARVFQALRIEINQELKGLREFFERIVERIKSQTRIVAISFHSLEDRIVKHTFIDLASSSSDQIPALTILTKKPVTPTEREIHDNFRARSAKLRAVERN